MKLNTLSRGAALCVAGLLVACGGGNELVRPNPPPTAAPPPAAPPPTTPPPSNPPPSGGEPCPSPVTGNCVVAPPETLTWNEYAMTGGRQSDFRLLVSGPGGWLNLKDGEYRFSGGTEIAGASLVVWDTLVSDVKVLHDFTGLGFLGTSELWLTGTLRGDLINEERVTLRHRCGTGLNLCAEDRHPRIDGNFSQGPTGTLEAVFGWDLQVSGTASLDGNLVLLRGTSQSYVLPTAPSSVLILHAGGGVTGQFDAWRAESLFLAGDLRYTANDVFFDATRVSLGSAITAAGVIEPLALDTARRLDVAFERTDPYLGLPRETLSLAQQQFIESAAAIQHIDDVSQATRSLASLAGHGHVLASDALHEQVAETAAQMENRLAGLDYRPGAHAWSTAPALHRRTRDWLDLNQHIGGVDLWVSPRLVVGGSLSEFRGSMRFDRMGGSAEELAPVAMVYARYGGNGWYMGGLVGTARNELRLERTLDLATAGQRTVRSLRSLDQVFAHAEIGTRRAIGRGAVTPFFAVDYSSVRSDAFSEQGTSGLELVVADGQSSRLTSATGVHFAREWSSNQSHWLRLDVDARYTSVVGSWEDRIYAAFSGAPDAPFVLNVPSGSPGFGNLSVALNGGLDNGWLWSLDYTRAFDNGPGFPASFRAVLHRSF